MSDACAVEMVGGKRYIVAQSYEELLGQLRYYVGGSFVEVPLWNMNGDKLTGALALNQIVSLRPWVVTLLPHELEGKP